MTHRIASSKEYSSGLIEIQTEWSIADVFSAHLVLNELARAEEEAMNKAKKGK